jgi:hypothetical protein
MRYKEISETPLADFKVIDDNDSIGTEFKKNSPMYADKGEGSFRQTDLKAMSNPKWIEKVHNFFKNCPYDFNIYLFNGSEKYRDLRHIKGIVDGNFVEKTFGTIPPNSENSINIILTNNEGDERVPLSPWILCHRIVHAFFDGLYVLPAITDFNRTFTDFTNVIAPPAIRFTGVDNTAFVDAIAKLSNFNSAKNKKIIRPGEYAVEIIVEYILTGKIKFNNQYENTNYTFGEYSYSFDFIAHSEYTSLFQNWGKEKFIKKCLELNGIKRVPKNPKSIEKYNELIKKFETMYSMFEQSTHWASIQKGKEIKYYENKLNIKTEEILKQTVGKYFVL